MEAVAARVRGEGPVAVLQVPLLHYMASYNPHPHTELAESVKLLVEAGADIDAKLIADNGAYSTALTCANARDCCAEVLRAVLQNGAHVLQQPFPAHANTALHKAAAAGRTENCELLMAAESSLIHVKDADGLIALMHAASFGTVDTVEKLIQFGADRLTVSNIKITPIMAACTFGRIDIPALLITYGADVNAVLRDGSSALLPAVQRNSTALLQLLLEHGADISATNSKGQTVLFNATEAGNVEMMELLVQHGLSTTAIDCDDITLLMKAAANGQKLAAEWLLQHGVDVNASDNDGCTALHCATLNSCDDVAMIELLLTNGADVHKRSLHDRTALDLAAQSGHLHSVKTLIAAGADTTSGDSHGATSLHLAVLSSQSAVVQLLLEHGATAVMNNVLPVSCSEYTPYCSGLTALTLCENTQTVKMLLSAGADVHVVSFQAILHYI
jgi:ankyrin repeat protein